jgi:cytidylate kinase
MGIEANEEEILNQLIQRDNYDSTREHSPLVKADNAFQIDTSNITIEEQTNLILNLASGIINQ